ncbi:BN159_2729 family protein [Streptomyces sp. NPDC001815]|uniref:BN159_2729 family protein n=1 Tax=Streptomyces sp. NPDC001815 TaxID=3154526 RepID=UPI0033268E21
MNRNLPHAERVIRTALAVSTSNQARAVAHALDVAHLLVDAERTFGFVLHRTPGGGWARVPGQLTELEQQAFAWDHACARAGLLAAAVEQHIGGHPDFLGVRADGDRVRVELHVTDQAQWRRWRTHFSIRHDAEETLPHAVVGESHHAGVRVSVLARRRRQTPRPPVTAAPVESAGPSTVPAAPSAAPASTGQEAASPPATGASAGSGPQRYEFEGITYDLSLPQRDVQGAVWYFHGCRTPDGMPLLTLDGRAERCTLANVTALLGPLTALEPEAGPTAQAGGAETARPDTFMARPTQPDTFMARPMEPDTSLPTSSPGPALPLLPSNSTSPTSPLSPSIPTSSDASAPPVVRRPRVVRLGAARLTVLATPVAVLPAAAGPPAEAALRAVRADPADPADATSSPPPAPDEPSPPSAAASASASGKPSLRALRPPPALASATALTSVPGTGPNVPSVRRHGLVRTGPATREATERADRSEK